MSHFVVLVIGQDVEKQLAPFHEFECTGVDEFVQDVDITQEIISYMQAESCTLNDALEYYGLLEKTVMDESRVDKLHQHKYGYAILNSDSSLKRAVDRTNPNKKWDWYTIGGRWTGYFKLKDGATGDVGEPGVFGNTAPEGSADSVLKRNVDFEFMRNEAGAKAADQWDSITGVIAGRPMESWVKMRDRMMAEGKTIDEVRAAYNAQEPVKDLQRHISASGMYPLFDPSEIIDSPREQYVKAARDGAATPFAVLMNGQWHERGSMGWFGCVSNEKPSGEWEAEVNKLLDSLPDDTLLTAVDCHI